MTVENVEFEDVLKMSQEELAKLDVVEPDNEEPEPNNEQVVEPEPEKKVEENTEGKPEDSEKPEDSDKPEDSEKPEDSDKTEDDTSKAADLVKHVSPPEKFIQQRLKNRAGQEAIAKAKEAEEKAAELQAKLDMLKAQGVDVDASPLDKITDEKLEEISLEHGEGLAEVLKALKILQQGTVTTKAKANEETPSKSPENGAVPESSEAMEAAIEANNDLSYWREASTELWERAVKQNEEWLADSGYLKLPYEQRFNYVVQAVKEQVLAEAKAVDKDNGVAEEKPFTPPSSLANKGSSPSVEPEVSVIDKLGDDITKIVDNYDKLTPEEQAEVDKLSKW